MSFASIAGYQHATLVTFVADECTRATFAHGRSTEAPFQRLVSLRQLEFGNVIGDTLVDRLANYL